MDTVYISYNPAKSVSVAQMLFNGLAQMGYDVYMDLEERVDSINLGQIAARAHFIIVLSPDALNAAGEKRLSAEFDAALHHKRNILVIATRDTDVRTELAGVTGTLKQVAQMPLLHIHAKHIHQVIHHLADDFLLKSPAGKLIPTPQKDLAFVKERQAAASRYTKEVTVRLNTEKSLFEAVAKIRRGDYDDALHDLDLVIAENPLNESAYLQRGRVLRRMGRITAALRDYERAASLSPKMVAAQIGLGEMLLETERFSRALEAFDAALAIQDSSAPALAGRALAMFGAGDTDAALQTWQQLVQRDANYADALWAKDVFDWREPLVEQAQALLHKMG